MREQPCAWDSPTAYRYCYTHGAWRDTPQDPCPIAGELHALRAQVQRVRELRDEWERIGKAFAVYGARLDLIRSGAIRDIDRALDGGGDE